MSPIPGEPHADRPPELHLKDGRTVKLKIPGLAPLGDPRKAPSPGVTPPPVREPGDDADA